MHTRCIYLFIIILISNQETCDCTMGQTTKALLGKHERIIDRNVLINIPLKCLSRLLVVISKLWKAKFPLTSRIRPIP